MKAKSFIEYGRNPKETVELNDFNKNELEQHKKDVCNRLFECYSQSFKDWDKYYSLAESKKISGIYTDLISEDEQKYLFARAGIVILSANKYEMNILHQFAHKKSGELIKQFTIKLSSANEKYSQVFGYYFEMEGCSIIHLNANVCGAYTIGGTADLIRWINSNPLLYPTVIVSFGICFGFNLSDKIGKVVLSKKVYPYFIGAKVKGNDLFVVDDNVFSTNSLLMSNIQRISSMNILPGEDDFEIGNFATGEAVISSVEAVEKIKKTTKQHLLAGEMEGYGLYKECHDMGRKIPCVIIKGICDWGIEKNIDVKDEEKYSLFCSVLKDKALKDKELRNRFNTLKERSQAYAAACAFNILDLILKEKRIACFPPSLFDTIKEKMTYDKNNTVRDCNEVYQESKTKALELYGFSISRYFFHTCCSLFEQEQMISLNSSCKDYINNETTELDGCQGARNITIKGNIK